MKRAKNMLPILIPLFISSFRRADELALAMEARCYRGGEGRTRMHELVYGKGDALTGLVMLGLFALLAFLRWGAPCMKRTIKATVAYDGTNYQGFQRQKNGVGVQQVLEKALTEVLKEPILSQGCRPDDAGPCPGQVISFATESRIPPENYRRALEPHLPPDIAIREAEVVRDDFHARFDAVDKTYQYKIYYSPCRTPPSGTPPGRSGRNWMWRP